MSMRRNYEISAYFDRSAGILAYFIYTVRIASKSFFFCFQAPSIVFTMQKLVLKKVDYDVKSLECSVEG